MSTCVENAGQQGNRMHVAACQGWSVAHHREMSEQALARAYTERTTHYGKEPDHGEH